MSHGHIKIGVDPRKKPKPPAKPKGFAAMSPERRRELAIAGGKARVALGVGHSFTGEEARTAGRKGGKRAQEAGTANRFTSETAKAANARILGRNCKV